MLSFKFTDCFKFFSQELRNTLKVHSTYWIFQLVPRVKPFLGEGGGMTLENKGNNFPKKTLKTRDEFLFSFRRRFRECRRVVTTR